jgi:DNA-binding response OmpR family regulator
VPIIFITAFPDEAIRARASKAGAICFLTKPFDGRTLIRCVSIALERQERNQYVIVLGFGADLARAKCERFWKVEIRGEEPVHTMAKPILARNIGRPFQLANVIRLALTDDEAVLDLASLARIAKFRRPHATVLACH